MQFFRMDKNTYIDKASDPASWFAYAKMQKQVADTIQKSMLNSDIVRDAKAFQNLWVNAHYHYGIAIENGLKGLIIKNNPESVVFDVSGDRVKLKSLGKSKRLGHNLLPLAEEARVFEIGLHKFDSDIKALRMVLSHLTDAIKWLPKYPVPIDNKSSFVFDGSIPMVLVYGFHILDVMEPLFELFESEAATCV